MVTLAQKVSYGLFRRFPSYYWRSYDRKAREARLDRLHFILSFDCDTDEDIWAAERLEPWLKERGIKSTYAVPGKQLERGATAYRRIADAGSEFINHGYRPHAEFRDGRYYSATFYDKMPEEEVAEDIRRGHETVTKVIGKVPVGFRAPHFGHFQGKAQLGLQYRVLKSLGYRYSTSTVPLSAYRRGPIWDAGGIIEIPLSGSFDMPANILDSWSYLEDFHHPRLGAAYGRRFMETVDGLLEANVAGVLNYYVDPAHVVDGEVFRNSLEYLLSKGVQSIDYGSLISMARPFDTAKGA